MISRLSNLYELKGYNRFKMSKFEEYDLYVKNKDFLISDNIITFNDIGGKLLALKPDVTLSIVKNTLKSSELQKVYYNENVYRVSEQAGSFKEIMQVGLECVGEIDTYLTYEVISLAVSSLMEISENCVLDLSDLKVLSSVLNSATDDPDVKKQLLSLISLKSAHEIDRFKDKIEEKYLTALKEIALLHGEAEKVLENLSDIIKDVADESVLCELKDICALLKANGLLHKVQIDFSVISDIKYYNGIVFKGFVDGVGKDVLSGGRYDNLIRKMGNQKGAIGFAVYLDRLENLMSEVSDYDADVAVLYDNGSDLTALSKFVNDTAKENLRVVALKTKPERLKVRKIYKITGKEVSILEDNA